MAQASATLSRQLLNKDISAEEAQEAEEQRVVQLQQQRSVGVIWVVSGVLGVFFWWLQQRGIRLSEVWQTYVAGGGKAEL